MAGNSGERHARSASLRRVWYLVVALLLATVAPGAGAGELSLLVNGVARHVDVPAGKEFNERNWGSGLQYDFDRSEDNWVPFLSVSGFKDSFSDMSYYAGGGVMRRFDIAPSLDNFYLDIGAVAFVMTRQTYKDNDPFLGALPAFTIGTAHFAVNISYVPKVHPKLVPLWFFQLKIPLGHFSR
jgi:hypothetical protein